MKFSSIIPFVRVFYCINSLQAFIDYFENLIKNTKENTDKGNNKVEKKREIICFHMDALQHKT